MCTSMAIREPELEIAARIGITPEAYKVLRRWIKERKQSMVKIVSDLILGEKATLRAASNVPEPQSGSRTPGKVDYLS